MIIGISGKLGSGKDTVAKIIQDLYPQHHWEVRRFANRLKQVVATLTDTSEAENHDRVGKQMVPPGFSQSLGSLQQLVGMALRQHVDENVWVNLALANLPSHVVIPDVRFPNEVAAILEKGGIILRLQGGPTISSDSRNLEHSSETALDFYPFSNIIQNDSDKEDLQKNVHLVLQNILGSK